MNSDEIKAARDLAALEPLTEQAVDDYIAESGFTILQLLDEVERLRMECSGMGKLLESGVVVKTDEYSAMMTELQSARTRISELEKMQTVVEYLTKERNPNIYMAIDLAMQAKGWLKDLELWK